MWYFFSKNDEIKHTCEENVSLIKDEFKSDLDKLGKFTKENGVLAKDFFLGLLKVLEKQVQLNKSRLTQERS